MRLPLVFLLLALSLVLATTTPTISTAQPNTTSPQTAWTNIVVAFQTLQTAESDGAPHDKILELSIQLNNAIADWNQATGLAGLNDTVNADYYARLSIGNSTAVASQASALDSTARSQTRQMEETVYASAFLVAIISSVFSVKLDRVRLWIRTRRERRMRVIIEPGTG